MMYPAVLETQGFPPGLVEGLGRIAREFNLKVQVQSIAGYKIVEA